LSLPEKRAFLRLSAIRLTAHPAVLGVDLNAAVVEEADEPLPVAMQQQLDRVVRELADTTPTQ